MQGGVRAGRGLLNLPGACGRVSGLFVLIMGKPKAGSINGISLGAIVFWNVFKIVAAFVIAAINP